MLKYTVCRIRPVLRPSDLHATMRAFDVPVPRAANRSPGRLVDLRKCQGDAPLLTRTNAEQPI